MQPPWIYKLVHQRAKTAKPAVLTERAEADTSLSVLLPLSALNAERLCFICTPGQHRSDSTCYRSHPSVLFTFYLQPNLLIPHLSFVPSLHPARALGRDAASPPDPREPRLSRPSADSPRGSRRSLLRSGPWGSGPAPGIWIAGASPPSAS